MDTSNNVDADSSEIVQESVKLGPEGEGNFSFDIKKDDEEDEKPEEKNNLESRNKGSKFSSTLKNLVRGKSKTRNEKENKEKDPTKQDEESEGGSKKNDNQKEGKHSLGKLFQNVSNRMTLRRGVFASTSSTEVNNSDGENDSKHGVFRIFRKSTSKTELESDANTQELSKLRTLGRLFSKKSSSKIDLQSADGIGPELKTLTLGRRISSTFRGAFDKSERGQNQTREAPQ